MNVLILKTFSTCVAQEGISLTTESAAEILDLPNGSHPVKYELDVDVIDLVHDKFAIGREQHPRFISILGS
jgi:hypothetical protein